MGDFTGKGGQFDSEGDQRSELLGIKKGQYWEEAIRSVISAA